MTAPLDHRCACDASDSAAVRRAVWTIRRRCPSLTRFGDLRPAQCPEPGSELVREEVGLFPCGEVPASVEPVVVDQLGIGPLGPAAGSFVLLAGKDADRDGDANALGVE